VEVSLRRVQREFDRINPRLSARRDPLTDPVVDNMLAGYAKIDAFVAEDIDLFALGQSKHLLELNTLVLCGASPERRETYARHIEANERRFYDHRHGGVRDLIEWHARHERQAAWRRAAGVYIRVLTKPQLFIEGNHRTGALLMSYVLLRSGLPPFVLTVDVAAAYFDPSTLVRSTGRDSAAAWFRLPKIRRRLVTLLREHSDRRYLLG